MRPVPSLRAKLLILAGGSALPVVVLALVFAWFLVEHEGDSVRKAALERNRAFMTAIDAKMSGHVAVLAALGSSPALAAGNLRAFMDDAIRIKAAQPDWRSVKLFAPTGEQLLNTAYPLGTPLPPTGDRESFDDVVRSGALVMGNMSQEPSTGQWGVPVRLPILVGGQLRYVLQFVLDPAAIGALIRAQGYPTHWSVGLVDRHGRLITRWPERPPGEQLPPAVWELVRRDPEGWFTTHNLEGARVYSASTRSAYTGWSVGTALPFSDVYWASMRVSSVLGLAALVALAAAAGFAWRAGRRIADPIDRLAQQAKALGEGQVPDVRDLKQAPHVLEVLHVANAIEEAGSVLREREALRAREQESLRAADRAKDEFLAMLGHELRNPLSAITTAAQVLRISQPGSEATTRAHGVIDRQARQMARLVEDLLDISRLTLGKVTLQLEPLDLCDLVTRVLATWRDTRPERSGRELHVTVEPAPVRGDRARLEQVLVNLLDNADKFSPVASPIEVSVRHAGAQVQLEVRDHGQGISAEDLSRIFDMFVQGEQSIDRPHGGIGLGLALVRRLVELQGGTVAATSEGPGRGASFVVSLPSVQLSSAQEPACSQLPAQRALRILLVEDNEDGRIALEEMLRLGGHVVEGAASAEAALDRIADFAPDVVVSDIGLPRMDGYELARRIAAMKFARRPTLVALSGYGLAADRLKALKAGYTHHLVKPVNPDKLQELFAGATTAG